MKIIGLKRVKNCSYPGLSHVGTISFAAIAGLALCSAIQLLPVIVSSLYLHPGDRISNYVRSPFSMYPENWNVISSHSRFGRQLIYAPFFGWAALASDVRSEKQDWFRVSDRLSAPNSDFLSGQNWEFPGRQIAAYVRWSDLTLHPTVDDLRYPKTTVEVSMGWPLNAFSAKMPASTLDGTPGLSFTATACIIRPKQIPNHRWLDTRIIPFRPVIMGLLWNAWFYFLVIVGIKFLILWFRRKRRSMQGLCLRCGYNRAYSELQVCSECGSEQGPPTKYIYYNLKVLAVALGYVLVITGSIIISDKTIAALSVDNDRTAPSVISESEAIEIAKRMALSELKRSDKVHQVKRHRYGWHIIIAGPFYPPGDDRIKVIQERPSKTGLFMDSSNRSSEFDRFYAIIEDAKVSIGDPSNSIVPMRYVGVDVSDSGKFLDITVLPIWP